MFCDIDSEGVLRVVPEDRSYLGFGAEFDEKLVIANDARILKIYVDERCYFKEMSISSCPNLLFVQRDNLPVSLSRFHLSKVPIRGVPVFNPGLLELSLEDLDNVTLLPDPLPVDLKILNIHRLRSLESLEKFPEGLEKISLSGCVMLKQLPKFPKTLKTLNVSKTKISSLNNLPDALEELDLADCNELIFSEKLQRRLEFLEANGCRIIYPKHNPTLNRNWRPREQSARKQSDIAEEIFKVRILGVEEDRIEDLYFTRIYAKLGDVDEVICISSNNGSNLIIYDGNVSGRFVDLHEETVFKKVIREEGMGFEDIVELSYIDSLVQYLLGILEHGQIQDESFVDIIDRSDQKSVISL